MACGCQLRTKRAPVSLRAVQKELPGPFPPACSCLPRRRFSIEPSQACPACCPNRKSLLDLQLSSIRALRLFRLLSPAQVPFWYMAEGAEGRPDEAWDQTQPAHALRPERFTSAGCCCARPMAMPSWSCATWPKTSRWPLREETFSSVRSPPIVMAQFFHPIGPIGSIWTFSTTPKAPTNSGACLHATHLGNSAQSSFFYGLKLPCARLAVQVFHSLPGLSWHVS